MDRAGKTSVFVLLGAMIAGACGDRTSAIPDANAAVVPATYSKPFPDVGARVRIIAPSLGPGWRVGVFNRTRQEPPCYVVMIFDPTRKLDVGATVFARSVVRMQISTLFGMTGTPRDPDPAASAYEGEQWVDVPVDAMQHTGQNCPDIVERPRR